MFDIILQLCVYSDTSKARDAEQPLEGTEGVITGGAPNVARPSGREMEYFVLVDHQGQALTFDTWDALLDEYKADGGYAFREAIQRTDTRALIVTTRTLDEMLYERQIDGKV